MKNILLACLLGIGALLPTSEVKSSIINHVYRIISITIEGNILSANSAESDGGLKEIQIYNTNSGALVAAQTVEGYNATMNISDLPVGNYIAYVISVNSTATKKFKR